MKKTLPFIIIVAVLAAGIAALVIFSRQRSGNGNTGAFVGNTQQAQTSATTPQASPAATISLEKPNVKVKSPIVLEEYGDYQCPPCGALHPVLKQIEHEYGDQLRVVFHHFPLTRIHKNAMAAARAAEAARNQGKFWQMHDQLYRNQNSWKDIGDPRSTFIGYAHQLGLNVDRFTRDMDSPEVEQRIASDMQKGTANGVNGTPTVFIEGHMLRYESTTPDGLRQGINYMLTRKAGS